MKSDWLALIISYVYVFAMIVAGAALMPVLVWWSPSGTEMTRWCLGWFLFGESFFVPAVMWLRLVVHDGPGQVFGRFRYAGLGLYLLFCVLMPIGGMACVMF